MCIEILYCIHHGNLPVVKVYCNQLQFYLVWYTDPNLMHLPCEEPGFDFELPLDCTRELEPSAPLLPATSLGPTLFANSYSTLLSGPHTLSAASSHPTLPLKRSRPLSTSPDSE